MATGWAAVPRHATQVQPLAIVRALEAIHSTPDMNQSSTIRISLIARWIQSKTKIRDYYICKISLQFVKLVYSAGFRSFYRQLSLNIDIY